MTDPKLQEEFEKFLSENRQNICCSSCTEKAFLAGCKVGENNMLVWVLENFDGYTVNTKTIKEMAMKLKVKQ